MKKILLALLITAALVSSLCLGQIMGAVYIFDSKIESALNKVQSKVKGLSFDIASSEGYFGSRRLVVNYAYALSENMAQFYKTDKIYGAFELNLNIGILAFRTDIKPVRGYGNLDTLLSGFSKDSIDYHAVFEGSAFSMSAGGVINLKPIQAGYETLQCTLGESAAVFDLKDLSTLKVDLKSAGLLCNENTRYNFKNALNFTLRDLLFSANIDIEKKSIRDNINFALSLFDLDFSTVYALGFKNDEKVKDMSVRERFTLEGFNSKLSLKDAGQGKTALGFDAAGNIGIFMPYIKNDRVQSGIKLDNMLLNFDVDGIMLGNIDKALKLKDAKKAVATLLGKGLFSFNLKQFSFVSGGDKSLIDAKVEFFVDEIWQSISSFEVQSSINLAKSFIRSLPPSYQKDMENASVNGVFSEGFDSYSSSVSYKDGALYINGTKQDVKDSEPDEQD